MRHYLCLGREAGLTCSRITASAAALVVTALWCCSAICAETRPKARGNHSASAPAGHFFNDRGLLESDIASIPHGIVRPVQRVTMSAPLLGRLVELRVKDGDPVIKDQILAVMDNRVATAAVHAARAAAARTAQIAHAQHALTLAESLFERQIKLRESQAGAEFELERARSQRDQAEATLASAQEMQLQAQRNLALEQARLESHFVRAPFDGKVIRVDATVGSTLAPADKLLSIICLDSLEAELHLPLEHFGEVEAGKSYRLWAFAPVSGPVTARMVFTSPTIDPATGTFRCLLTIDNGNRRLPAGFGVRFDSPQSAPHSENAK